MDPEILAFDEPTSSLDPELAHEVFRTIKELAQEGQTMLIVTHQLKAIKHFATRVAFLYDGKIEPVTDSMLNESESAMLDKYRMLPAHKKEIINTIINSYLEN